MPPASQDVWAIPKTDRVYGRILTVNDGPDRAWPAFHPALRLARAFDAELHMLSVCQLSKSPALMDEVRAQRAEAERRFAFLAASAAQEAAKAQVGFRADLTIGHPVHRSLEYISANRIDLLVLGELRGPLIGALFFSPLVVRLAHNAPCAVLLVR
jgi:nucleotide-binding universal stress UspA family protein